MRRLLPILAALCLLGIVLTIDVAFRGGTLIVNMKWYHLLLLAPPLVLVARHNSRRFEQQQRADRRNAGLCPTCAYDLRATPDRCPECGASSEASPPPTPVIPD